MSWQFQALTSDLSQPDYRGLRAILCVRLSSYLDAVWHPAAKHEAKQNQTGAEEEHRPRFRSGKSVKGCTRELGRAGAQRGQETKAAQVDGQIADPRVAGVDAGQCSASDVEVEKRRGVGHASSKGLSQINQG